MAKRNRNRRSRLARRPSPEVLAGQRPWHQPPREDLTRCRRKKYRDLPLKDFAAMLGVSRLHVIAVERGYRYPSYDLAVRWLAALAPYGSIELFGEVPTIQRHFATLKKLEAA